MYFHNGDLMKPDICIDDIFINFKNDQITIKRENGLFYISNLNNNGFSNTKSIFIYPKTAKIDKAPYDSSINIVSADIENYAIETSEYVSAIVFAQKNDLYGTGEINKSFEGPINIIILINKNLNNKSLMKAYSKSIEAKVAALWDLDVRSDSWDLATGNNEDNLLATCTGISDKEVDENELQYLVGKCVRKALRSTILRTGYSKSVIDFIEGIGIEIDDLVEAGMELCVGVEETEELHQKLKTQILKSLEDLNVVSFIIAGIRLEEDYMKHRVKGVNVDDDPAYLYSDEVFGMSIANQIAGTKAIFNFKRYDEEKPGIISTLGPVLDDVFAGLIAGCMSKIFEE